MTWVSQTPLGDMYMSNYASPSHMTRLFHVCKAPKVWRELPNGSHNDTVAEPRYFQYIEDFLSEHVDQ
jgi:hypothetical protein